MEPGSFRDFSLELTTDAVGVIRFDTAARMNSLTRASKRDLIEVLLQIQMDDRYRVVVFTGAGEHFVVGDDLNRERQREARPTLVGPLPYESSFPLRTYDSLRSCSQLLNLTIRQLGKLTIAAINGYAIQSGLSLALACDFRIAAADARLGSGTLRYGFLPDEGGHWLLVQHVGLGRAMDLLMRNRVVTGEEALDLGLVHQVVSRDELLPTACRLAAELAQGPQVAMRLLKRALNNAPSLTFEQALDDIASKTAISDHHSDALDGRTAFIEKRPPRFNEWLET